MRAPALSIETYLTVQIQEIVGLGPHHTLTWAGRNDLRHRLQISVERGERCHLLVQCDLPSGISKAGVDRLFRQYGWTHIHADNSNSLAYYLAQSRSLPELKERSEEAAKRCARAMRALWKVESVEQLALLGARGPRLALSKTERTSADDDTRLQAA